MKLHCVNLFGKVFTRTEILAHIFKRCNMVSKDQLKGKICATILSHSGISVCNLMLSHLLPNTSYISLHFFKGFSIY
jgi:hypothetical protein